MDVREKIRANAELVITKLGPLSGLGKAFGYNRASVAWVDGFIEQQRVKEDLTPQSVTKLAHVIGSYLGECIVRIHGGQWRQSEGRWGVFYDNGNGVFPFAKVRKQFKNGRDRGDSILGFLDLIEPVMLKKRE